MLSSLWHYQDMQDFLMAFQEAGQRMQYQDERYQRTLSRAEETLTAEELFAWIFDAYPELLSLYQRCLGLLAEAEEQVIWEQDHPHLQSVEDLRCEIYRQLQIAQEYCQAYHSEPTQCIEFMEDLAHSLYMALAEDREQ